MRKKMKLPASAAKALPHVRLGLGAKDAFVHQCDHVAYFWETDEEFNAAVGFLAEGIKNRDHCVVFGYQEANERVMNNLHERGFNVTRLIEEKRVTVLGASDDGDATLQNIGSTFQQAMERGATMIRLLGNIGWNRPSWPEEEHILAFEAKVTGAACAFPCVVICMYDVRTLPGHILIRGGFETHPVTIRGNVVRVNPMYVPADDYLKRIVTKKRA
jgi:hypothetical protein